jgi:hypothetical protein
MMDKIVNKNNMQRERIDASIGVTSNFCISLFMTSLKYSLNLDLDPCLI